MTINREVTPNWGQRVEQTFAFSTKLFRAEDGSEVRVATALDPRVMWKFTAVHFKNRNKGEKYLPGRNQGAEQRIPDPVEKFVATFASGVFFQPNRLVGGFNVAKFAFEVGDVLFVAEHGFCTITGVGVASSPPEGIIYNATVDNPPPDGAHMVHVTRVVRNNNTMTGLMMTSSVGQRTVNVSMVPPVDRTHLMDSAVEFPQYRGYPLFDFDVDWSTNPQHEVSFETRGIDTSYGIPFTRQIGQLVNQSTYKLVGMSEEKVREIIAQFIQSRGRHAPFYAPAALPTVPLRIPAVEGSQTVVADLDPEDIAVWDQQILRNFLIDGPGESQPTGIVNAEAGSGGTIITLDAPVTAGAAGATSMRWLTKSRFSNDEMKLVWETNTAATVSFAITALIDSFHEIRMGGYRIFFNGVYVTFPKTEFTETPTNQWDQP